MAADGELQEHHGLQLSVIKPDHVLKLRIGHPAQADQQQAESLHDGQQAHDRRKEEDAVHVPAHRLWRRRNVVIGYRHDRDVVEQRQRDDHDGGDGLELKQHDRGDNQHHDVERHRHAIMDIAFDPLEDLARDADRIDDRRQARRSQDEGGRAPRGVGGAADGDAAIRLLESRRIVDAVAGHPDDVAARLQGFHDLVFVLRKHPAKAVGALDRVHDGGAYGAGACVILENVARDQEMIAEIELGGDLVADRDIVAGDHFHVDPKRLGRIDGRLGIGAWRIHQRDEPDNAPGLAVIRLADAERAIAFAGEFGDGGLIAGGQVGIRLGQVP